MACCLISFLCEYLLLSHKFYFCARAGKEKVLFDVTQTRESRSFLLPELSENYYFHFSLFTYWPRWLRSRHSRGDIWSPIATLTPILETIFSWDSCVPRNISIRNIKLGESQLLMVSIIFKKVPLMFHIFSSCYECDEMRVRADPNFESLQNGLKPLTFIKVSIQFIAHPFLTFLHVELFRG